MVKAHAFLEALTSSAHLCLEQHVQYLGRLPDAGLLWESLHSRKTPYARLLHVEGTESFLRLQKSSPLLVAGGSRLQLMMTCLINALHTQPQVFSTDLKARADPSNILVLPWSKLPPSCMRNTHEDCFALWVQARELNAENHPYSKGSTKIIIGTSVYRKTSSRSSSLDAEPKVSDLAGISDVRISRQEAPNFERYRICNPNQLEIGLQVLLHLAPWAFVNIKQHPLT